MNIRALVLVAVFLVIIAVLYAVRAKEPFTRPPRCPPNAVFSSGQCRCKFPFAPKNGRCVPVRWNKAWNTWYSSYPPPGSEEWDAYSGGQWAGLFKYYPGKQTPEWVARNNIVSFYDAKTKDAGAMAGKRILLSKHGKVFQAMVLDSCADADCMQDNGVGCCTNNSSKGGGYLVDIEKNTCDRIFGTKTDAERNEVCGDGNIWWAPG